MTPTTDFRNLAQADLGGMRERLGEAARPLHRGSAGVLRATVTVSALCVGALAVLSSRERGSPWAGLNAVTTGLGLASERPRRRFEPTLAAVSLATIVAGSAVTLGVQRRLASGIGRSRIGAGLVAALTAAALDRVLMRREIFGAFRRSLGTGGTVLKYAAMGLGVALTR